MLGKDADGNDMLEPWLMLIETGISMYGLRLEADMSILKLKTILKRECEVDCAARNIRLFQGKTTLGSNNDSGGCMINWLAIDDSEVKHMKRIDYSQEVVDRFTRPEVEVYDEKLLRDYFHEGSFLPDEFDQLHVLVYIPSPLLRVYCKETKQMETLEFVIELRRAEAVKKRAEEVRQTKKLELSSDEERLGKVRVGLTFMLMLHKVMACDANVRLLCYGAGVAEMEVRMLEKEKNA